jgi:hypothetical protein
VKKGNLFEKLISLFDQYLDEPKLQKTEQLLKIVERITIMSEGLTEQLRCYFMENYLKPQSRAQKISAYAIGNSEFITEYWDNVSISLCVKV